MTGATTSDNDFSFDRLSNIFVAARSFTPPSQLHGLLCGQLSAGLRPSQKDWLETAAEQMASAQDLDVNIRAQLADFYDVVLADISSDDFSFAIMLPDSDESVEQRTEALGQWCAGFISGYGTAGHSRSTLSEETSGVLTDLAQVSQVQIEDLENSEETEKDFFEVCEYVRMATLMLFGEQQGKSAQTSDAQSIEKKSVH